MDLPVFGAPMLGSHILVAQGDGPLIFRALRKVRAVRSDVAFGKTKNIIYLVVFQMGQVGGKYMAGLTAPTSPAFHEAVDKVPVLLEAVPCRAK